MSTSPLVFAALFCATHAATCTWTGIINDQQWTTANNWAPSGVPGPADDVIINDKETQDATVVLVQPVTVKSLTVGAGSSDVLLRVLSALTVTDAFTVAANGIAEVNSGAAAVSCNNGTVDGELQFAAGTLMGAFTITGKANFGEQSAKILDGVSVKVTSQEDVIAAGSIQFKGTSTVTATTEVKASGQNTQFIVMDSSTGNSFTAKGFSWVQ